MKSPQLVPELYSTDLVKTIAFYCDLLGFKILFERKEERFIYLQRGGIEIMIEELGHGRNWITGTLERPFGRGVNFQIEIEDVQELHDMIIEHQLPLYLPMEEKWYSKNNQEVGNKQFIIQDPDGYLLRFYQDLGSRDY